MNPTLVEGVGQALHQLVDASTAHADNAGHVDHDEGCPEDGCTPVSHHCGCCASVHAIRTPMPTWPQPSLRAVWMGWHLAESREGPHGVALQLERPPRG